MLVAIIFAKIIPCYLPRSDSNTFFLRATPGTSGGLRVVHVPAVLPAGPKPGCVREKRVQGAARDWNRRAGLYLKREKDTERERENRSGKGRKEKGESPII